MNKYVAFNEVQILPMKRLSTKILEYLEDIVIISESVQEIQNNVFLIKML